MIYSLKRCVLICFLIHMFMCCCRGHDHYLIHLYAMCLCDSHWKLEIDGYPHPSLPALIHGRKNKLLHVACSTKTLHVCVTYSLWQAEITRNREKVVNRLRSPRVSPHYCFIGGVKFPQGEGSAVIHCKKNDPLHKDGKYI